MTDTARTSRSPSPRIDTGMPAHDEESIINLRWLLRLRWGACAGQLLVILAVDRWLDIELNLWPLLATIALAAASNVALILWARQAARVSELALAALLTFDIVLLTIVLAFSGASFNPFNFLYLVYLALATVVLRTRWTWGLVLLSLACFAALFRLPADLAGGHAHVDHASQMQMHLEGMWVAFAVAAVFIVYFVQRIRRALAERDAELSHAREQSLKHERLAALVTLAAGAAHEIATPLGTIAVVAGELARRADTDEELAEDVALIQQELGRCREVLDNMSVEAGQAPGEAPEELFVPEIVAQAVAGVRRARRIEVRAEGVSTLWAPRRSLTLALRRLLDNACDASTPEQPVVLTAECDDQTCRFEVRDEGHGMTPEVIAHLCEPFFTTKQPGEGMGLGLFLVQALAERLGGELTHESEPSVGTRATLVVPRGREA